MRRFRSALPMAVVAALATVGVVVPQLASPAAAEPLTTTQDPLVMTYGAPAPLNQWQEQSLPIGNGAMGASIFGQVTSDEVFLNEKTLWTGGPGVPNYRFGNYPESELPTRRANLKKVQDTINANGTMTANQVAGLLGQPKTGYGNYQTFGRLQFAYTHESPTSTDYVRSLDLNRSLAKVEYTVAGTRFTREYFASYPDNVVVMRVSADQPGKVTFSTKYDPKASPAAPSDQQGLAQATITAANTGRIDVTGALADNGLKYNAQTQVTATGGTVTASGQTVTVTGADSAWLVWSAGTDYKLVYPAYRTGEDAAALKARVGGVVDAAVAKGWAALQAAHEADYKSLFDRLKLNLGGAPITVHTDAARSAYRGTTAQDRSLEVLYYQFGRYLLISSSRAGSLPANLQGVWNQINNPPWSADYHTNINLQMNYWPALSTNLGETTKPYLDYIKNLADAGADSAKNVFGMDSGWMVMNETTPFGFTGLFDWATSFWFPEANAWIAQAYYWEWLYNRDTNFLRDKAWPILKGAADFWANYLTEDPRDGTLVANPSYSPEQGPFSAGAAMSQQIAAEILGSTIDAAAVLGKDTEVVTLKAKLAKLDQGLTIGSDGLIQEWKTPGITGEPGHRHVSHLYALFPGRSISPATTPELAKAAEASLRNRGDGGTGWSMAWKINFWANLLNGDQAHQMVKNIISNSTYPNLWDAHPPFQIDGNFGATSGMTEMLVQNDGELLRVLPALPAAWANGSVDGIRAWNNTTVGATWASGNATQIRISTGSAGPLKVATGMAGAGVEVKDASGATVPATVAGGVVTFDAKANGSYTLAPKITLSIIDAPAAMDIATDATIKVGVTGASALSQLKVEVPSGWQVSPSSQWLAEGDSQPQFTVRAPASGTAGSIVVRLVSPGGVVQAATSIALNDTTTLPGKIAGWNTQERTGEGLPNGLIAAAVDGNPATYWHSSWSSGATPFPHYLIVDLGAEQEVASWTYTPRNVGGSMKNGNLGIWKLEAATAGSFVPPTATQLTNDLAYPQPANAAWSPVTNGAWPTGTSVTASVQTTNFTPVKARYLKLTITGGFSDSGDNFSHAAEIAFSGTRPTPATLPDANAEAKISVSPSTAAAGDSLTVSGGGFTPASAVSVQVGSGQASSLTADANGFITATVTVPVGQAAGSVPVTATGDGKSATAQVTVTPPASTPPASTPPASTPPASTPPASTPPASTPPASTPPASTPPTTKPPTATPPTTKPPAVIDVYTTPGFHVTPNGRSWYTTCEKYSQTVRCRTNIWATTIALVNGKYVQKTDWVFNNLTYLPLMTRKQWGSNPLANPGLHNINGRSWRTECDTALTGRNACRSWIWTQVISAAKNPNGQWQYTQKLDWVFNNIIRFKA